MAAGSRVVSLLSTPLNFHVLQALEQEPLQLDMLRRQAGSPPQTTMRVYMKALSELGIVERRQQNPFPGTVEYGLSEPGEGVLRIAQLLQHWLDAGPHGPIALGTPAAKHTVKALVDGWSTNIVRAVAARPATLGELARAIPGTSYPTLERRLTALRHAGLVEPLRNRGRGTPYRATEWLRRSIGPLTGGLGWEQRHIPALAPPVSRIDVEATFLLAVPLLDLSPALSGRCRLAVELPDGERSHAGILLDLDEGQLISCLVRLEGEADAWVCGTPMEWFRWMIRGEADAVEIGGDQSLAEGLGDGLRASIIDAERL